MSKLYVDAVEPEGASTVLTLGTVGDTVNIGGTAGTGFPLSGTNTPNFYVSHSTARTVISDATWTPVTFDEEAVDSDSAFTSNAFTVPAGKAGTYYLQGGSTVGDEHNGCFHYGKIRIRKTPSGGSAATLTESDTSQNIVAGTTQAWGHYLSMTAQCVAVLAVGDAITLEVYSDGASGNPSYYGSDGITRFMGFKLL